MSSVTLQWQQMTVPLEDIILEWTNKQLTVWQPYFFTWIVEGVDHCDGSGQSVFKGLASCQLYSVNETSVQFCSVVAMTKS